jgi:F-type H+-transporting ATPase subunit gamma
MANKRILVKRRKSVRNIRKITRTMQLIATARFQAALNRATATKPYTEKLAELVGDLSSAADRVEHPLMKTPENTSRAALVVITSNRGLCGGFNANVLRTAVAYLDEQKAAGVETEVRMAGKKGVGYFRFLKRPLAERLTAIGDKPRFSDIEPLANGLMDRFVKGEIAAVRVAYMRFFSVGKQRPVIETLLPLQTEAVEGAASSPRAARPDYEFSPEPQALLDELLPASVRVRLFQCFTDAIVSEQIARMVAMKAATDAAGDMIKSLTRQYNRARQTQITMELLDIVGGANALA